MLTFIFLLEMARGFDADGVRVTPAAVGLDGGADAGADLVVDDGMLFDHGDDRVVDERPEMGLGGGVSGVAFDEDHAVVRVLLLEFGFVCAAAGFADSSPLRGGQQNPIATRVMIGDRKGIVVEVGVGRHG